MDTARLPSENSQPTEIDSSHTSGLFVRTIFSPKQAVFACTAR